MLLFDTFKNGLVRENPVLRLVLGTCPTLAISTKAMNGIGMGLAAIFVLVGSNLVISLLRKIIPDKVRIPAYITIIAGFVTIAQLIIKAYAPAIDNDLGIYLPLIVVNCIILGRAEMFASKNKVLASVVDGVGMGIGFTAALLSMGIIRELLGAGTVFGFTVFAGKIEPLLIMGIPPGGFFVFGILIAVAARLSGEKKAPKGTGCHGCPSAATCGHAEGEVAGE